MQCSNKIIIIMLQTHPPTIIIVPLNNQPITTIQNNQQTQLITKRMPRPLPLHQQSQQQLQQGQQISSHQQSSQFIKVKYSGRKNLCEICDNIMAKYTCPKCQMKTCCLGCTRKHKEVKGCSGERQPVEYVSREEIDEKVVAKDYNFIEEMISGADKVKKVLTGVNTTITLQPRRFKILRTNAKQLYNIRLSNGPNILERHRDNISFYYVKDKAIYWVFELLYFRGWGEGSSNGGVMKTGRYLTQPVSDERRFMEVLPEDYLDRELLEGKGVNSMKREEFCVFLENKEKQSEWVQQGNDDWEQQKSNRKNLVCSSRIISGKFTTLYQLMEYDIQKPIHDQMRDISVFEFPTLFVVYKQMKDEFLKGYKQSKATKIEGKEKERVRQGRGERERDRQRSREKNYGKKVKADQEEVQE